MDQTLALILHGCNLARQLESNLVHFAQNPEPLAKSCDEILTVFLTCKDRLQLLFRQSNPPPPPPPQPPQAVNAVDQSGIQQWLRTAAMERLHAQVLENMAACTGSSGASVTAAGTVAGGSDSAAVRAVAASSSGSQQRRRRQAKQPKLIAFWNYYYLVGLIIFLHSKLHVLMFSFFLSLCMHPKQPKQKRPSH
ncbi:unnamed protein product [Linum trigynum]|uniref:Uncharacterized protein n=1 Tax=Linum trigynum TaxID=586398 RepID=A0AAV2FHG3_9ROSI